MKKYFFFLTAMVIVAATSCVNVEKEREAIKAVIEEETEAYYAKDLDRLAATYVQDEFSTRLGASSSEYGYYAGWNDSLFRAYFTAFPDPETNREKKSNFRIKVYGTTAWAVYDNDNFNEAGELTSKSIHAQFLEKTGGKWKIAFMSIVTTSDFDREAANRKAADLYHKFNPGDMDDILTDNFVGKGESGFTWNKENHRKYWTENPGIMKDTVLVQIVEGDWGATKFQRSGMYRGKMLSVDITHIKHFSNGKIDVITEFVDTGQMPK